MLLALFFFMNISIYYNIFIIRQVLGFIFLFFIPGMLILCILNPSKLSPTEVLVLSVGLSISSIMFFCLIMNSFYPLFGYDAPLSVISLDISLTIVLLILAIIANSRNGFAIMLKLIDFKYNIYDVIIYTISIIFLPLSVFGMHLMNKAENNAMVIALLFLMPAFVIIISMGHCRLSRTIYPLIIFIVSVSIILLMGMRSSHIIGNDAHIEYYIFQKTLSNEAWHLIMNNSLDSCLSISILPVVYQSFININAEYLFKILYPLFFSISPLIIYQISNEYLTEDNSFLASIFFICQNTYIGATSNPRTVIAILFVALSIMIMLNNNIPAFEKKILLLIFIISCVVSHYSTAYIFFVILILSFIFVKVLKRIFDHIKLQSSKKNCSSNFQNVEYSATTADALIHSEKYLTVGLITIFFVVIFVWYSQVTGAAFESGLGFISKSFESLQDFFIIESRSEGVSMAFGSGIDELEVPRKIRFIFNWLSIIFIAIGVLHTSANYYKYNKLKLIIDNMPFLYKKGKFDLLFLSFSVICSSIMLLTIALPFVSNGYGIDRAYLLMTIVLSAFFVIGGIRIAAALCISRTYLIVLIVLVPLFMCATGSIYQIFGYSGSMALNSEGSSFDNYYIYDQETNAAKWSSKYINNIYIIYSDLHSHYILISQGLLDNKNLYYDSNYFIKKNILIPTGYFFLRSFNIVHDQLIGIDNKPNNISIDTFHKINLIYNNGRSKFFENFK